MILRNISTTEFHVLLSSRKVFSQLQCNDILPNRLTDCISDQLTSVFLLVLSSSPFEDNRLPIDM